MADGLGFQEQTSFIFDMDSFDMDSGEASLHLRR
jgi:hypothetical protein